MTATGTSIPAHQDLFDYFSEPGPMTSASRYLDRLHRLASDPGVLSRIAQGLLIHEYMAPEYGVTIAEERKCESHLRSLEQMLDTILAADPRPLDVPRAPEARLVSVCNHFAVILVGMLRAHGIPARARWGFGAYFNPPFFEDHVLGEYWSGNKGRWVRVDAQLDEVFRKKLKIDFDPLDVPHDQFVAAGDAWGRCRTGEDDPEQFGIFRGNLRGLWFVAGSLIKDLAALDKMEMLPWDTWGAMPAPGTELSDDQLAFFDRLAGLSRAPDYAFEELRELYERDTRVRVSPVVFNAILQRAEAI